jgi:hypothetical protein
MQWKRHGREWILVASYSMKLRILYMKIDYMEII